MIPNQETQEARVMNYARRINYDEVNALLIYQEFQVRNRKRAYERTLEFLAEKKEEKL